MVRGPCRYRVLGVVDASCAGGDADTLLDGRARGIPVFMPLRDDLAQIAEFISERVRAQRPQ